MKKFDTLFVAAREDRTSYEKHVAAPLFRRSFDLKALPESAEIEISGLGFYQLFVNGKDVTKGYLAPYISNPDEVVYYDAYDLKEYLVKGENVIGVVLGDGMINQLTNVWDFDKNLFNSSPRMAVSFYAKNGEDEIKFGGDSFKCTEGPITFNNHRSGVHYDARLEKDGWSEAGYDDSDWREPIVVVPPRGKLRLCEADPITVRHEFSPVAIYKGEVEPYRCRGDVDACKIEDRIPYSNPEYTGGYIFDFGKNSAGVFRLRLKNTTPGQLVSLQCSERKNDDGRITYNTINYFPDGYCQRDIYICRGAEEEVWTPQFVYHGYQYLYVTGLRDDQAVPETLTYIEINTSLTHRAKFNCSDERINKLYNMCDNSDLSNFHYFPTDCPHREKNGWTGDAAASAEHMVFTLSVEKSWREWMNNIRAAQNDEGYIPGIVPTGGWGFEWGNGPAWDRVIFDLPYQTYIYRGETDMIRENANMMLSYLELLARKRNKKGIIDDWGLGDWCNACRAYTEYGVPLGFTNGVIIVEICRQAVVMFEAVGLSLHADFARKLGAEMKDATRRRYLNTSTMTVEGNYQTGQAMAIYYGILEDGEKKQAFEVLLKLIHDKGDFLSVGYLGARAIFHVLSDFGYTDLAYKMISRPEYPSYGRFIDLGLTTIPEQFINDFSKYTDCSFNHHFFCDIKQWFLRQLVGINVNPYGDDPEEILLHPHFSENLTFAEGEYNTPGGKISVRWEREEDKIYLKVQCDGDAHYRITVDGGYKLHYWAEDDGKTFWEDTRESYTFMIEKGTL